MRTRRRSQYPTHYSKLSRETIQTPQYPGSSPSYTRSRTPATEAWAAPGITHTLSSYVRFERLKRLPACDSSRILISPPTSVKHSRRDALPASGRWRTDSSGCRADALRNYGRLPFWPADWFSNSLFLATLFTSALRNVCPPHE